jgi:DNA-binding response OmpR family regulator
MQNYRVLFISQEEENCKLIQVLLGLNHYEAVFAATLDEGLQLIADGRVHLVLLDWSAQDMEGDDLRRMIDTLGRQTPLLLYTGVAYKAELENAIGDGEDGFVVPPVDMGNLLDLITFYLQKTDTQLLI